ncbi:TetR family transcriptional regulator [Serinibacter arcticus]|uniref:TetR family transcriptional regulator n=1 Tax=Serinibacter arcticus TaxID=1655435 RepID=A0A2U1ZSC0_9MICO|nr:TetR family transcriptional regulator [Serinibacter arcticus]PWD49879.1 TetR family transcriptional regulator [Serinibacter arcticus]
MTTTSPLRDVARRAVHAEIASTAERLFREHGFDATTVDQIAAAVGMSQRTFFRHVGGKDDLVLSTFVEQGQAMVEAVAARPDDEDLWVSLRHGFAPAIAFHNDAAGQERAMLMWSIVESSPTLRAAYLERMETVQRQLIECLASRSDAPERPVVCAVVGAAFAALNATQGQCDHLRTSSQVATELDAVMGALTPRISRA